MPKSTALSKRTYIMFLKYQTIRSMLTFNPLESSLGVSLGVSLAQKRVLKDAAVKSTHRVLGRVVDQTFKRNVYILLNFF